MIALVVPLAAAVAMILAYNALRFGNPFETGYSYQLIDPATVAARHIGLFSWQHFPGNFYRALLAGPVPIFASGNPILLRFPYLTFDGRGLSWLLGWPLLVLLLRVDCRRPLVRPSAVTAGAIALPLLASFAHGEHQYGYRFAFDFLPFLLLALLAGLPGRLGRTGKALIVIGGLFNAWLTLPVLLHLPAVAG